jgi:ABC-type polysaccharide transport system permease subunit
MKEILKKQWRCDIEGGRSLLWIAIATHIVFLFFFYSFEVFCNLTSCLFCHFDPFILSSSWIGLDEFFSWLDVGGFCDFKNRIERWIIPQFGRIEFSFIDLKQSKH